jgi:hypothetical protein
MSDTSDRTVAGPTHRDLYLLAVGIFVGVLLGPAVLGRLAPRAYQDMFIGRSAADKKLELLESTYEEDLRKIQEGLRGATEVALTEALAKRETEHRQARLPLQAQVELDRKAHAQRVAGWMTALIVAVAAFMVIEVVIEPAGSAVRASWRGRVASVRYALIATWAALLLAQPALLLQVPVLFLLLVIAVAVAASAIPLGRAA